MSESPEQKSKRKFVEYFVEGSWNYQTTLFLDSVADVENALELFAEARKKINRKIKGPVLWRIGVKNRQQKLFNDWDGKASGNISAPYLTFFTEEELGEDVLFNLLGKNFPSGSTRLKSRTLNEEKLQSVRSAISNQRPHNLESVFKKKGVQRYGLLNSDKKVDPKGG